MQKYCARNPQFHNYEYTNLNGIRFGVYNKLRLLAHSMIPVCLQIEIIIALDLAAKRLRLPCQFGFIMPV